jgi:hypothetical protein
MRAAMILSTSISVAMVSEINTSLCRLVLLWLVVKLVHIPIDHDGRYGRHRL